MTNTLGEGEEGRSGAMMTCQATTKHPRRCPDGMKFPEAIRWARVFWRGLGVWET